MNERTMPGAQRVAGILAAVLAVACLAFAFAGTPAKAAAGPGAGAYAESTGVDVVYATLSEALAAAPDGDTVHVLAEGVSLGDNASAANGKTLRVVGDADASCVTYEPGQKGLALDAAHVTLEHVAVRPAPGAARPASERADALFTVGEGSSLALARDACVAGDAAGAQGGAVHVAAGGSLSLEQGSLIEGFAAPAAAIARDASEPAAGEMSAGGAVFVEKDASFVLAGGTIADCAAYRGGAVYAQGSVRFESGSVRGCSAHEGAAVYVAEGGSFENAGATIADCTAYGAPGDVYRASDAPASSDNASGDALAAAPIEAPEARAAAAPALCTLVGVGDFDSVQAAVDAIPDNTAGVIEMNVAAYTLDGQVEIGDGRNVTITTASGVDSCAFTCSEKQTGGLALFGVRNATLVLDGTRNGRDGADANGIVLQGADDAKEDDPKGNRGIEVRDGGLTLKDVTVRRFSADFGSIADVRATGIDARRAAVSLEGFSLVKKCTMFNGGGIKEKSGGVTVYGDESSDTPTSLFMGPDAAIEECRGTTGGLAVSNGAKAVIQGAIRNCSTFDGTVGRCAGGLFMSVHADVVLENAVIEGNHSSTGTPNVTAAAGAIWIEGGNLAIHGATITSNTTNSRYRNAAGGIGMNIDLLSTSISYTRLALSGKVVVKDNRIDDGRTQTNVTLAKSGVNYMHYLVVDGSLDPGSYVGITARGGGSTERFAAGEAFAASGVDASGAPAPDKYQGAAAYAGDAKGIANLNCLVNDRDDTLRGQASWDGWTSPGYAGKLQARRTLPDAPAAIVWARSYDLKVLKTVDDPTGTVAGAFPFTVQTGGARFSGAVYDADGTPTGQTVQAHGSAERFELADGQYVLFENVTAPGAANAVRVSEEGSVSGDTGDSTEPFVCDVSAALEGGGPFGSTAPAQDGSAQWQGSVDQTPPGGSVATVTFVNRLRTGSLSVEKKVEGAYGDTTRAFAFRLTLHAPSFVGADRAFSAHVVSASGDAAGSTLSFTSGVATPFSLKSGERLVFDALPVGTTYGLSEEGIASYLTSAEVATLGSDGAAVESTISEGSAGAGLAFDYDGGDAAADAASAKAVSGTVAAKVAAGDGNTVRVVNRMPSTPPTGVSAGGHGASLALVVGGIAILALTVAASFSMRSLRRRLH